MREFSPVSPWRWLRPGLSVKPVESSLWNAKSIDFSLSSPPPSTSSFLACQFCELKNRLLLGFRERTVIGSGGGGEGGWGVTLLKSFGAGWKVGWSLKLAEKLVKENLV